MYDAEAAASLSTPDLKERIQSLEQSYREGNPLVSDDVFDHVFLAELKRREPDHPLLQEVGAEVDFGEGKVVHPSPMLSTDKAYTTEEVRAFVTRVKAAARDIGVDPDAVEFRLTPKLDGMAARLDGALLVTRGNGLVGNDVSSAISKGVVLTAPGVGEIVMQQSYFDEYLSDEFEHPRNVVVGAVSAKEPNADAQKALDQGAIRFVNYESLHNIVCVGEALLEFLDEMVERVLADVEYPTDGVVIEVLDPRVKEYLGSTSHHHRWQIAKKSKGESAVTTVTGIRWTTGRTGRITPTVLIEPVKLSGATLSKVTAHHAGNVRSLSIGVNASVRILRSGLVIPFLESVLSPAEVVAIPDRCPTCNSKVEWENDFIVCKDVFCDAQCRRRLGHFFEILGNVDLFGSKTIESLVENGHRDLLDIYKLTVSDFEACGFGPKQSENLVNELVRSRTDAVEDWRFLAAIGISYLGRGSSRRLLKVSPIEKLVELTVQDIVNIESFGPVVAPSVHTAIQTLWPAISGLLALGFNLVTTSATASGGLSGKRVVFTGAMPSPRKAMEEAAQRLGAEVQSAVSAKTDWLVTGERVGMSKLTKAEKLGVKVMPLAEYEAILANLS